MSEQQPETRTSSYVFDDVVDSLILALGGHSTEDLRAVADEAELHDPNSWLARMIREFLEMWR